MARVVSSRLKVGMEVHVELATRTKMFSRALSPACAANEGVGGPNTCIDPVVLGLPGALPVANREAVRMAMMVGLALGCRIAEVTRWDRKNYFYPDLPKGYQISQFDMPLCAEGVMELPRPLEKQPGGGGPVAVDWESGATLRIGIIRAHLEEDAGKLLHEAPGGGAIDFSIADYNRAGTPLLEIVTRPDFSTADEVVLFCQSLRNLCRFLGVTGGVMQKGHMRFEPNINCELTLDDGRTVATPIVEVKNLNSFRAVRGAVEFEAREQPRRWEHDGREAGRGTKETRGWDDVRQCTLPQREKEDAHDYRYFPDPDLLPVRVGREWVEEVRAGLPELPIARVKRYRGDLGLSVKDAAALVEERGTCEFFEACVAGAERAGVERARAGKLAANLILQSGAKRVNEAAARGAEVLVHELGISPAGAAGVVRLRADESISAASADELFGLLCEPEHREADAAELARVRGMMLVRDAAALDRWVEQAIAENAKAAEDVRAGKDAAIGRLVGAVMKLAGGQGDAKTARERLLATLRGG